MRSLALGETIAVFPEKLKPTPATGKPCEAVYAAEGG